MIKHKRLTRIETTLSPKQAILFWLRQERQGKTLSEYVQWMMQRPRSAAPRTRVELQVVDAIRATMKGQEPARIYQAARQGQMYADFLIVLVNRTNRVILDDWRCRWFQIALLYEQLRTATLSKDEEKVAHEWAVRLRGFATELFSLQRASELIQNKYFDGECILFKDALEELEQQAKTVRRMMDAYDRVAIETNQPQLATDSNKLDEAVGERAFKTADYIVALARSNMLDDFGEAEAADAILRPYILEGE